ncbi:NAD(P)-dependent oxidoreductase, partial [Paenarthrobacter sp. RAF9]
MDGKRVGFVGLGLMGAPMAANIAKAGWAVTGWNRSDKAFRDLRGVKRAAEVAHLRDEDAIIFMLPDLPFIEEAAQALLESWRGAPPKPGTAVVIMSSVSPTAVQQFGQTVHEASGGIASVVDAPVSGGTKGAEDGTLAIMVGADEFQFEALKPLLETMGTTVRRMG